MAKRILRDTKETSISVDLSLALEDHRNKCHDELSRLRQFLVVKRRSRVSAAKIR